MRAHRETLQERAGRLARLIDTVDKTILHLKGELEMPERELYQGFSEEKQQEYEQEVRQRYGDRELKQSQQRWGSYDALQRQAIQGEFQRIVTGLRDRMALDVDAPEIQELVGRLHAWAGNFYDCSLDIFEGLGRMYNQDRRFREMYETTYGPGVSEFLERAIGAYCERQRAV
jgi:hypothetical protein